MKKIIIATVALMMAVGVSAQDNKVKVEKKNVESIQKAETAKDCKVQSTCKKAKFEKMECCENEMKCKEQKEGACANHKEGACAKKQEGCCGNHKEGACANHKEGTCAKKQEGCCEKAATTCQKQKVKVAKKSKLKKLNKVTVKPEKMEPIKTK